ncbi:probable nucleoredoxin 1 [Cornus florida]|uniref:probable nucleoredoxin 1 n=1 Tax=Cornus florida TaxID=4283 RepID=UPI00289EE3EF|nr:probable nucleoredoxin 1 [Cornus florida]
MADEGTKKNTNGDGYDLKSLLTRSRRDFLVRNDGEQVKIDKLKGKKIGLYFSRSTCASCQHFTPELVEVYNKLSSKNDFEIILVSADDDAKFFEEYFVKMPWLAIPFSDLEVREKLNELFKVEGIPHLVILDEKGEVLSEVGAELIMKYGEEVYPFTPEKVRELKEQEEAAKKKQTLRSILVTPFRDFVLSNDGNKVPVSELEGKPVALYFFHPSDDQCLEFTPKLVEVYDKLKEMGRNFEIVMVFLDDHDEELFKQSFGSMPWLALPFRDGSWVKLCLYFEVETLPALVIIGPDGKTLHSNAAEDIEEHGIQALKSLTPEMLEAPTEIEEAKQEAETIESILVLGNQDFVIRNDGSKVQVSDLVGKNILLYFSANGRPDRNFVPKLIQAYHKIKAKDNSFEVIFISSDNDQASFDKFFSRMPWLALPFGDVRSSYLISKLCVSGTPIVVAIGPNGQPVTTNAADLIRAHGAGAYPFTEDRLKDIETEIQEMGKLWPKKVEHKLHKEHQLVLTRRLYFRCDGCGNVGRNWSFVCEECNFDLHPRCALAEDRGSMVCKLLKNVQSWIEFIVSKIKMLLFGV